MKKYLIVVFLVAVFSVPPAFSEAQAEESIKIGFFAPMTGFAAADGVSARRGAEMAAADINEEGGINGKKVELVIYDDHCESKEAVAIAHKLIEKDRVVAVVSGSYSSPNRASSPIFQKASVPMLVSYATSPDITKAGDFVFRDSFVGIVEGKAGAEVAVKEMKAQRIAVLTMDNDRGRVLADAFSEHAKKLGSDIVLSDIYALGEKEFTPYLVNVKEKSPDLLYTSGYYSEAAMICKQADDLGLEAPIMGQQGFDSPMFLDLAGEAAEGVIITTNLNRDDPRPVVQNFITEYEEQYDTQADMVGASCYDAVQVMARAIETAGTDPEAIRDAIANTKQYEGLTGMIYGFNELGEVTKPVQVQIVKNGRFHYFAEVTDREVLKPPAE
jgi:branched-chain amino acid transport system substrate-binding protein